jgi:hypothetical protein
MKVYSPYMVYLGKILDLYLIRARYVTYTPYIMYTAEGVVKFSKLTRAGTL